MSRFSPTVAPVARRPIDFSPLSEAFSGIDASRDRRRAEEISDADLALRIRAAGGVPSDQFGDTDRVTNTFARPRMPGPTSAPIKLPSTPGPETGIAGAIDSRIPGVGMTPSADPYADVHTDGRGGGSVELGGGRSPATRNMVTASGSPLAAYMRPYSMTIRGTNYTFDPMHQARVKAAEQDFEDQHTIDTMRRLGADDHQILRSLYPDRSYTADDRREHDRMNIAARYGIEQMRAKDRQAALGLRQAEINLKSVANDQRSDELSLRRAYLEYLTAREARESAKNEVDAALREYGIEANTLPRSPVDQMMLDPDELAQIKARIEAAGRRARSAVSGMDQPRLTPPGTPPAAPTPAPAAPRSRPANPYRSGARGAP